MNSFKQHYIPVVLSIVLLISFGLSACGSSNEDNSAESEKNTRVIDSNVNDEAVSDDPARDSDEVFDQLLVDKANKVNMSQDEFAEFLADNNIGFVKMTSIFKDIVEDLMFNGMSPEEVEAQKNALANLMKK